MSMDLTPCITLALQVLGVAQNRVSVFVLRLGTDAFETETQSVPSSRLQACTSEWRAALAPGTLEAFMGRSPAPGDWREAEVGRPFKRMVVFFSKPLLSFFLHEEGTCMFSPRSVGDFIREALTTGWLTCNHGELSLLRVMIEVEGSAERYGHMSDILCN